MTIAALDNAARRPVGLGAMRIDKFANKWLARQFEADQQDRVLAAAEGKPAPKPRITGDNVDKALQSVMVARLPGGRGGGSNTTGSKAIIAAAVASGVPSVVDPRTGQAVDVVKVTQAQRQLVPIGTAAVGPVAKVESPTAEVAYDTYAKAAEKLGVQVVRPATPPQVRTIPVAAAPATPIQIQIQQPAPVQVANPVVSPPALSQDSYAAFDPNAYAYQDPYADPYAGQYADPYAGQYADPYAGQYVDPYAGQYVDPYAGWGYDTGGGYADAWGSWGSDWSSGYDAWGGWGLQGFSLGSVFKSIGNIAKAALPAVLPIAASFIPGVGGLVAGGLASVAGGAIGGGATAASPQVSTQPATPTQPVGGAQQPGFWSQIGTALSQAAVQAIPVVSQALLSRLNQQQAATGTLPPGFIRLANGQIAQVASTQGAQPPVRQLPPGVRPVSRLAPTGPAPSGSGSGLQLSPGVLLAGAALLFVALNRK